MAALVRKAKNRNDWDNAGTAFTLNSEPFFTDLAPQSGQLSVWRAEHELDLLMAAAAIASTRDYLDKVDFLVAAEDAVEDIGVEIAPNSGLTPYAPANHLHRDLESLTVGRMVLLADEFLNCDTKRFTLREVKAMLLAALDAQELHPSDLKETLREKLGWLPG